MPTVTKKVVGVFVPAFFVRPSQNPLESVKGMGLPTYPRRYDPSGQDLLIYARPLVAARGLQESSRNRVWRLRHRLSDT
jgi:hypothetical protein